MRPIQQECASVSNPLLEPCCPWDDLGLAPSLLELIRHQGRAWAREHDLARESFELLGTLTGRSHALLRQLVEDSVTSGFCSSAEGLLLLVGTSRDDEALAAALTAGDGTWMHAARYGCGAAGMDHPGLEARVSGWPLQESFPHEEPPPEWEAWGRLAISGTLGAAARKVLGSLLRRGLRASTATPCKEVQR